MIPSDLMPFWLTLGRPLTRLLFAMCIGLLIANIVEALRWTQPPRPPFRAAGAARPAARSRRGRPFPWPSSPQPPPTPCCPTATPRRNQPARARARQPVQQPARLHGPSADHAVHALARARRSRPYLYGADPRGGRAADPVHGGPRHFLLPPLLARTVSSAGCLRKKSPSRAPRSRHGNGSAAACPSSSCSPSPCTSPCT